ncbi:ABC transporter permease subunit [Leifsonia poae]|uniref:ABC transporter permease subunit n=1 Tax=Leifsonia poae TaxID=110933 RepID=UPI003D69D698
MSVTTASASGELRGGGVSFGGILAGEWIKLLSLRSTWWVTVSILPVTLLIATLLAGTFAGDDIAQLSGDKGLLLVAQPAGAGILFSQLIIVVLGTLAITSEYGTGMIRSSFAAVPSRLPLLVGKAVVVGLWGFGTGVVSAGLSWAVCLPLLLGRGASITFGEPAILLWSVLGTGAVMGLTAVFALGVGTVLRSSAGGLSVSVGALFVLTVIVQIIAGVTQSEVIAAIQPYLLSPASGGVVGMGNGPLVEWQSLLVVLGWATASLAGGLLVARRRDV